MVQIDGARVINLGLKVEHFQTFYVNTIKIPPSGQESGIENVKIWSRFVKLKSYSINCLNMINIIHLLELFSNITDMLF